MSTSSDRWNPAAYQANAGFVPALARDLVDLLDPKPGERVLDLGCGDGQLTMALLDRGARVVAVDRSPAMVEAARGRGLDAHVQAAETLSLEEPVDAVFTNAVLHWTRDIDAVLARVHDVLVPGGRFVGEFGGHGNVAAIMTAIRAVAARHRLDPGDAHYYPTPEAFSTALARAGLTPVSVVLRPRPTPLPTGVAGWLATFRGPMLGDAEGDPDQALVREIEALLQPALCDDQGRWTADYVRLRFSATRPVP